MASHGSRTPPTVPLARRLAERGLGEQRWVRPPPHPLGVLRLRRPVLGAASDRRGVGGRTRGDRKSTRLNSSHVATSYAVFCLRKKKLKRSGYRASTHIRRILDEG